MKKIFGFLLILFGIIFFIILIDLMGLIVGNFNNENHIEYYFGIKDNEHYNDLRFLEQNISVSLLEIYIYVSTLMSFLLTISFLFWGFRKIRNKKRI